MTTLPRLTAHRAGRGCAPALVAVTTTAAGTMRAATAPTVPETTRENESVTESPGPVVGSVCTGYGGLDLGVLAALDGGRLAWVADPDPHIAAILAARLPGVPNLGDVRAVDWTAVEPVDVLTAGFPCQDISAAGRRAGIENGTRSGLWTDIVAAVRVLRPTLLVVENVAALRWRNGGFHRVLGDLAEAGYDTLWCSVRAADIGAAHRRERVFLLAWRRTHTATMGGGDVADTDRARRLLQRHLRHQPTGRSDLVGPGAAAADTDRDQPERRRTSRPLAGPPRATPSAGDQWQRDGHALVDRGPLTADTDRIGRQELHPSHPAWRAVAAGRGPVAADTTSHRRDERLPGPTRLQRGPDAALSGHETAHPADRRRRHLLAVPSSPDLPSVGSASTHPETDWGEYTLAIRQWERVLGRPAPDPTQSGRHGRPVLAPPFVEWLQGLEPGWVTGLPLPRTAQLRALGNGVVPQQASYAVGLLLADLAALLSAAENGACPDRSGQWQEANAA